jgi:hypothetical protein
LWQSAFGEFPMSLSPHIHGTSNRAANWMTSNDGEPGSERRE